ncbi:DUF4168 domain-containing protein [Desulfobotulus mexicanus]|nr:DUF4168 domain-containing protein [Desulfobotulus mexicanus]
MYQRFYGVLALCVCVFAFMAVSATAQDAYQEPAMSGKTMEVSDADLQKAAEAYVEIVQINQAFQESVQDVDTPEERQSLQVNANEKMLGAVEDAGLNAQSYNMIVQQVGADENLRQEFTAKLRALQ